MHGRGPLGEQRYSNRRCGPQRPRNETDAAVSITAVSVVKSCCLVFRVLRSKKKLAFGDLKSLIPELTAKSHACGDVDSPVLMQTSDGRSRHGWGGRPSRSARGWKKKASTPHRIPWRLRCVIAHSLQRRDRWPRGRCIGPRSLRSAGT